MNETYSSGYCSGFTPDSLFGSCQIRLFGFRATISLAKIMRKFVKSTVLCGLSVKNTLHCGVFGIGVGVDLLVVITVELLFAEVDIGGEVEPGAL